MTVVGHGVDIVSISRIAEQISSSEKNWLNYVYSARELGEHGGNTAPRSYAGKFAAKEAVAKSLGTGFCGELTWQTIEILHTSDGQPRVHVSGSAAERAQQLGAETFFLSITYTNDLAMASVIAVSKS